MKPGMSDHDLQSFEAAAEAMQEGDRLFRARRFSDAVAVYQALAESNEVPTGELCAKLARGLVEVGRPSDACEWALKVVEAGASFSVWSAAAKVIERCGAESLPRVCRKLRVGVIGTWTTNAFVPLLKLTAARLGIAVDIYEAPFDQYFNETLDPASPFFNSEPEAVILCPDYRALGVSALSDDPEAVVESAVNRWANVWSAARAIRPLTIVQHNFALPAADRFGHFGSGLEGSRRSVSAAINLGLAVRAGRENVGLVDADSLAGSFGKNLWFDERNWHLAKVAVAPSALPILAWHTAAVLAARLGLSRRILVLDLDNTLWGGVVADDGVSGLTLGGGPDGEAFVDFQRTIKELNERGILLAVCSKNEMETAKEPFLAHPEMVLKLGDIAAFVANWRPKSENLVEIARTLNLGLDALTFVDDNPYERAEVRRALPEVDVIVLPPEPTGYQRALAEYPLFEPASFTAEDLQRAALYQARTRAEGLRESAGSLEEYQASLGMLAAIGPIDSANIARVVQLINKTNQFNVTTRRRDQSEVESLIARPEVEHFWVRLRDRFADHGLIAVVIAEAAGPSLAIDTLLMSCRVIGRGLEEMIRDELVERARRLGCREVRGCYVPTPRNKLVADLFPRLGFSRLESPEDGRTDWVLPVGEAVKGRSAIAIERAGSVAE